MSAATSKNREYSLKLLKTYKMKKEQLLKVIQMANNELAKLDVEWCNLCDISQQSNTLIKNGLPNKTTSLFENALELNAIPITIGNEAIVVENNQTQSEEEKESDWEDQ